MFGILGQELHLLKDLHILTNPPHRADPLLLQFSHPGTIYVRPIHEQPAYGRWSQIGTQLCHHLPACSQLLARPLYAPIDHKRRSDSCLLQHGDVKITMAQARAI
jgi:hypothetical protein